MTTIRACLFARKAPGLV